MAESASIDNKQSLYELLGISSDASQSEIKTAYRRLAKQYHPDVKPSPEANTRMSEINHAYSILSDPAKRAAYDAGLGLEEEGYEAEGVDSVSYAASFAQQARCQGCGKFDHTLRVVAFPYVISILIMSFKRFESGIFCHHCRSTKSTKWAVVSLLLGWWGFPWGIFWTIGALIANLRRGEMPREENQSLVARLAWANAVLGRIDEAKAALRDLLKYGANEEAKRFKDELDRTYPSVPPARVSGLRFGFVTLMVAMLAMYGFVGYSIFGQTPETSGPVTSPPTQSVPVTPPQTVPMTPPDDSFVAWNDSVTWTSETTIRFSGSVTNMHNTWSMTNVTIEVELLNKYDAIIEKASVPVLPSTIPPRGKVEYYEIVDAPYTCESVAYSLHWLWVPPQ